jgi:hypothetical protein
MPSFDEMPLILGVGMYLLVFLELSPFHIPFDLNGVLVATHFDMVQNIGLLNQHQRSFIPSCTLFSSLN